MKYYAREGNGMYLVPEDVLKEIYLLTKTGSVEEGISDQEFEDVITKAGWVLSKDTMTEQQFQDRLTEIVHSRGLAIKRVEEKLEQTFSKYIADNIDRLASEEIKKAMNSYLEKWLKERVQEQIEEMLMVSMSDKIEETISKLEVLVQLKSVD